jgi:hypothetical protein
VLSRRALNRAVLARQQLLARAELPMAEVLRRMGGLQAQYAPAMYIGLWSRMVGFRRSALTAALHDRSVVQATLMRGTIHLVARDDYWPLELAVRADRRAWYLRAVRPAVTADELTAAAATVRAAIAGRALTRDELDELVGSAQLRNAVGGCLPMVRVPPSGTWERPRANLFGAAEEWLGPPTVSGPDAVDLLVRRYLQGFGPASRAEIANWAGVRVSTIAPALDRLPLLRLRGEGRTELLDLPGLPLPDPDTPAPVRFLAVWDASLLAHARRADILPEEHRAKVFQVRNPHSVNAVLVDGRVAGSWRYAEGRVTVEEFRPLSRPERRAVSEEADRLTTLYSPRD